MLRFRLLLAVLLIACLPGWLRGAGTIPSTQITSFDLVNTSGTTASTVISPIMGLQFKKGDIPTWPSFQRDDTGQACVYSQGLARTWSDGSLKHISVVVLCPGTVAGSGSLQVDVFSGGSKPTGTCSANRTTTELSSANIQVIATGAVGLTGNWNATVADALTNGKTFTWMDGQAGCGRIIDGDLKQSGTAEGQVRVRWYTLQTQDASGNLGGIRFVPRVWQPYYDTATAKIAKAFSALSMCYGTTNSACSGGTPISWTWPYAASSFTWTSGTTLAAPSSNYYSGALNDAGLHGCVPVVLSNSGGALPAGLSTGTVYGATGNGTSSGTLANTNISLNLKSSCAGAQITPTGACTGTCTVTPTLTVFPGGTVFGHNASAQWQYDPGSLSADTTLRVTRNTTQQMAYWHSTRTLPPYNMSISGISTNPTWNYNWDPVTTGFLGQQTGATGDIPDLGPLNLYQVQAFFSQTAADELQIRTEALSAGLFNSAWRDSTDFSLPPLGNPSNTYTGMGTNRATTFNWSGGTGVNLTPGSNPASQYQWTAWNAFGDWSHLPATWYYGYLFTGTPEMLDLGMETANEAIATNSPTGTHNRNTTWPTQQYGLLTFWPSQERSGGWGMRDLGTAAGIVPDTSPEGIAYKSYFTDLNTANLAYLNIDIANQSAWTAGNGYHVYYAETAMPSLSICSSAWQNGYGVMAVGLVTGLTESTDGLAYLANVSEWYQYETSNFNDYIRYFYYATPSADAAFTTPITADSQWGILINATTISWSSSTGLFTATGNSAINWTVSDNDKLIFAGNLAPGGGCAEVTAVTPGGFTEQQPYYIVGTVTGTDPATFQLSATLGGSAVSPTNTSSSLSVAFIPSNPSSTGAPTAGTLTAVSYTANILAGADEGTALGVSGFSHTISDATSRLTAGGVYNCAILMKYCMQSSY